MTAPATPRVCVDCAAAGRALTRPAPHPGPRCATDHRAEVKRRKGARRDRDLERGYGVTPEQFDAIVAEQGGGCGICGGARERARARRLAVDHDHSCCSGRVSCGRCVRGALCARCNDLLGHLRDDPGRLVRAANYLMRPPARRALGAAS